MSSSVGVELVLGLRLALDWDLLLRNCILELDWLRSNSCCTLRQWWKSLGVLMSIDLAVVKLCTGVLVCVCVVMEVLLVLVSLC